VGLLVCIQIRGQKRQLVFVYFVFLVVVNLLDNSVRQSLNYDGELRRATMIAAATDALSDVTSP
jgi:hypothetical protein